MPLYRFLWIVVLLIAPTMAAAANEALGDTPGLADLEAAQERAKRLLDDPLHGVLVNRTMTVQGHDFYKFFAMRWAQLDEEGRYSLSIHERPSARWGSEIWVEYQRARVFHIFLPPARSQTKSISQAAAQIAYEEIENQELERLLFQSDDLGPEEM